MTQRCRMMTVSEMCRFQGLPPNRIPYGKAKVSRTKFARYSSNMLSVNVFQGFCRRPIKNAGMVAWGAPLRGSQLLLAPLALTDLGRGHKQQSCLGGGLIAAGPLHSDAWRWLDPAGHCA